MENIPGRINYRDVPEGTYQAIKNHIGLFSTAIFRIPNNLKQPLYLIGSGSFVCLEDSYGILTAKHVVDEIRKYEGIGIAISHREQSPKIDNYKFRVIEINRWGCEEYGPDMAFIQFLDNDTIALINSNEKAFFNLTKVKNINPDKKEMHYVTWVISGVPNKLTSLVESKSPDFSDVLSLTNYCVFGDAIRFWHEGYDYYEMSVEINKDNNLPISFDGISGGGLWKVLIKELTLEEPAICLLAGIIFYQSPINNNIRRIRCHGPNSLYKIAYEEIIAKINK